MNSRVPVAVFGYSRALQLKQTLDSLAACDGFADHPIHLFLDGAKGSSDAPRVAAVRDLARSISWPNLTLHVAPANRGLRTSIVSGVSELVDSYGRAIVIEDDLRLAPSALNYFSSALAAFEHEPQVKAVCGYGYKLEKPAPDHRAFFLPFSSSWGWGTWQRAWEPFVAKLPELMASASDRDFLRHFDRQGIIAASTMLQAQQEGLIDSWAILWNAYISKLEGMALFPAESMVLNAGFGTAGATHAWRGNPINWILGRMNRDRQLAGEFTLPTVVAVDDEMRRRTANSWEARLHRVSARLGRIRRKLKQRRGHR